MRRIDADAFEADCRKRYCTGCENYNGIKCKSCWVDDMLGDVDEAPTLSPDDVRGVGEWIETAMPSGWYDVTCAECSVCGEDFMLGDYCMDDVRDLFHYCPNCGARMKGAEDGTTD